MSRALTRKIGLLTAAVGFIALGLAMWFLPLFDAGDRVAGGGLIACGVLFVVLALWLGSRRSSDVDSTPGDGV